MNLINLFLTPQHLTLDLIVKRINSTEIQKGSKYEKNQLRKSLKFQHLQEITPTDIPSVKEYKVLSLQDLPEGLKLCDLALQCNAEALELKFLTPQEDTEGVKFCGSYRTLTAKKLRTHIRKTILNLSFLQNV